MVQNVGWHQDPKVPYFEEYLVQMCIDHVWRMGTNSELED